MTSKLIGEMTNHDLISKLTKKTYLNADEKAKIIEEAINADCIGIEKIDGKYRIYQKAEYNGHKIGRWISALKYDTRNMKLLSKLIILGVDVSDFRTCLSTKEKLDVLNEAINKDAEGIIKLKSGVIIIKSNTNYTKDNVTYEIGHWIDNAKLGNVKDEEFFEGLNRLNIALDRVSNYKLNQ